MTNHPHGEQLSAYSDDMLDLAQMCRVAQHLSACVSCRAACESLAETRAALRGIKAPEAPGPEFWAGTLRRLRTEGGGGVPTSSWRDVFRPSRQGLPRRWVTGLAAAAVLGTVVTVPLLDHTAAPPLGTAYVSSEADVVDMTSLMRAHADTAARQPLADQDRQTMISADTDEMFTFNDAAAESLDGGYFAADAAH